MTCRHLPVYASRFGPRALVGDATSRLSRAVLSDARCFVGTYRTGHRGSGLRRGLPANALHVLLPCGVRASVGAVGGTRRSRDLPREGVYPPVHPGIGRVEKHCWQHRTMSASNVNSIELIKPVCLVLQLQSTMLYECLVHKPP